MRIGYFADGPWAHEAFRKLKADESIEIAFVCVRYDRRDPVLAECAAQNGIDLLVHPDINSREFIDRVSEYRADLFVSMSFNQIFRRRILSVPPLKTINCHAGKLPFYRGRNILNWVLINDEKEFGITAHYVDAGIDTGDIIVQETYPITDGDDYGTLLEKAYTGCAQVLYRAVKLIQEGRVKAVRQEDIDPVGIYCGMRREGDEILDWSLSSREVFNFVRAICKPGPQARSFIGDRQIRINRVRMVEGAHVYKCIEGQVLGKTGDGFYVKTGDTMVEVTEYDYDGKIRVGDRLKSRMEAGKL